MNLLRQLSLAIALLLCFVPVASCSDYKDLSILVSSCDKYAKFWQPFFHSLDKNWPGLQDLGLDIFLISNTQSYSFPNLEIIHIPHEISWSDNMLNALQQVKTKYVLIFLDDYWINKPVNMDRFRQLYEHMQNFDVAYTQLTVDILEKDLPNNVEGLEGVAYKNKFQKYRSSLQLAIWEVAALKQILRSGESAWDFEMASSIRSSGYPKEFLTVLKNPPIEHINASYQGHITPTALSFAQAINPNFVANMPTLTGNNWDLKVKHIRHRYDSLVALIRRNISSSDYIDTYRYTFEDNK